MSDENEPPTDDDGSGDRNPDSEADSTGSVVDLVKEVAVPRSSADQRDFEPETPIDRARQLADNEAVVVAGIGVALFFLPIFLIDGLGVLADLIGISIGGYEGLATLVLAFGIAVVGFNLLLGYVELLSFGHAAFFGSAAYASAILASSIEITVPGIGLTFTTPGIGSPILMVLFGAIVATLLAWPIGFLSIRRSGVYFAVLTLTFGQMLYFFALAPGSWLTAGDNGFGSGSTAFEVQPLLGAIELGTHSPIPAATWMYLFTAVITLLTIAGAYRIINSPYGLIFKALGQNEQRVEFVGLNVFRYKLMAFIISGTYAGVGGTVFALHESYIHPSTALYWITSGDFVIMNVLGGVGTLAGPLIGALLFEYISNVISGISLPVIGSIGSLWRLILGAAFVLIVWVFPDGLWGGIRGGLTRLVHVVERTLYEGGGESTAVSDADVEDPSKGGDD
jgi:branched-chain amino acid transport system permease protein